MINPDRPSAEPTLPPVQMAEEVDGPADADAQTLPPTSRAPLSDIDQTRPHVAPPSGTIASQRFPQIPGYEILSELGRGGMGVVYKAKQLRADRTVALKMILAGAQAGDAQLARFRTEAEAIARLQHRNVVQVFEVGEHDGLPYFSMEFCPRGSLDRRLGGEPQPPAKATRIMIALAKGVQAAHDRHILHRDLKPQNVLIGSDGVPKITDFGLAKKLDVEERRTRTGAVMGTPEYMAPEQAAGLTDQLGPAADVWALGAILYELITGRPPFKAANSLDTILQVIGDEPAAPNTLVRNVPKDLETICLTCLRKNPKDRYASAADLLADLTAFRDGKPIKARPIAGWRKLWRWCKRHPTLALVVVCGVIGPIVGMAVTNFYTYDAPDLDDFRTVMERAAAGPSAVPDPPEGVRPPKFHRAWSDYNSKPDRVWGVAISDDGTTAAAARDDGAVTLYRHQSGRPPRQLTGHTDTAFAVAFRPGGEQLASGSADRAVIVWDAESGDRVHTLAGHAHSVRDLAYDPAGKILATAGRDRSVKLWDADTGIPVADLNGHERGVGCLAFSPDGARLVSGDDAGNLILWDVAARKSVRTWKAHAGRVADVCFTPDGDAIISAGWDHLIRRWAADAGESPEGNLIAATGSVPHGLAVHPSGWLAAVSRDGSTELWLAGDRADSTAYSPTTGKPLSGGRPTSVGVAANPLTCVAATPDGSRIVTAGWDRPVECWVWRQDDVPVGDAGPIAPKEKP